MKLRRAKWVSAICVRVNSHDAYFIAYRPIKYGGGLTYHTPKDIRDFDLFGIPTNLSGNACSAHPFYLIRGNER